MSSVRELARDLLKWLDARAKRDIETGQMVLSEPFSRELGRRVTGLLDLCQREANHADASHATQEGFRVLLDAIGKTELMFTLQSVASRLLSAGSGDLLIPSIGTDPKQYAAILEALRVIAGERKPVKQLDRWSPPAGYVGTKEISSDPRFSKNGKNPPRTTLQQWEQPSDSGQPDLRRRHGLESADGWAFPQDHRPPGCATG